MHVKGNEYSNNLLPAFLTTEYPLTKIYYYLWPSNEIKSCFYYISWVCIVVMSAVDMSEAGPPCLSVDPKLKAACEDTGKWKCCTTPSGCPG